MHVIRNWILEYPSVFTAVKVVLILALTIILAWALRKLLKRWEKRAKLKLKHGPSKISQKLFNNIAIGAVYVLGIITATNQIPTLSKALSAVLAGSGILAVIVGFAAQESFGNLVSGIFLTVFKPFDVGNRVHLVAQDLYGYIEDITLRHTVIRTATDTRLVVPNSLMGSAIVENTNFVEDAQAKNFIDVEVSYDSDIDLAMRLMEEAITSHRLYTGPKPLTIYVRELGASGIALRGTMTTATVDGNFLASSEARLAVKKRFDAAGVTIPYQTITISRPAPGAAQQLVSDKTND